MAVRREFIAGTWEKDYTFSPAVITEGGRTIWLSGQVGFVDDGGRSLAGDFDAQVRQTFKNLEKLLARAGATLNDVATMTVYVADVRHSKRFTDLRREFYQDNFPASALLTVAGFALPEIMLEIVAVAVVAGPDSAGRD